MAKERRTLSGYGLVKPYRQGDLSSFCGIYAAINAARLLSPGRANHKALWTEIYRFAVNCLETEQRLTHGLMHGLSFDTWKELQHAIYDELTELLGVSYRMRPLLRRADKLKVDPGGAIRQAVDADRVVLCALSGALDHYTVIAGYTSSRWLLHDSYGYRWVDMAVTAIGDPQGKRHWIPFPSLVVLHQSEKAS